MIRQLVMASVALLLVATGAWGAGPADESYRLGEARRLGRMAQQLELNQRMNWPRGIGLTWYNPFEPWPAVPGDIWGYASPPAVEQPVGQVTEQLGPNHWYSRPVYAAEAAAKAAAAMPPVAPQVAPAQPARIEPPRPSNLDEPKLEGPAPRNIKKPSGPRAF
jgi:hypothetical protein